MVKLTVSERNEKAVEYVGTVIDEGAMQLNFLQLLSMQPHHTVLEIGCGALVAGLPIMHYLNAGNYVGIEPNRWLVEETYGVPKNQIILEAKSPTLLDNSDFDASYLDWPPFNYILSHSVMSHASEEQLDQFLHNTSLVLDLQGCLLFSLNLVNDLKEERLSDGWLYPDSTFFHKDRFLAIAHTYFDDLELRPDFTKLITAVHPSSTHDWVLARRPINGVE